MSTLTTPTIKKLDQAVVNRIAAGEVIQRPANALKELIENSLDAGSTQIQILIKDGGLKLLQIQDNGHGIRKEDMAIVCERFTTSKLNRFEDLSQIATHGFRGEALASISHVAHVTITTKTADSPCAYRALYLDSKLVPAKPGQTADPKPCAGNNGTQITAEDLFFNVPTRKKALKSASDEYSRILDIVTRYAIHNSGIGFSCRKQGSNIADVQTSSGASILDNIKQLYGSVANELLPVKKQFEEGLRFEIDGYISNANYNVKKMVFLLFINHRSVESVAIKRAIESIYSTLLPKGSHPFIYLSLEIDPKNVDVNIHPTKKEVHFLYEERIIDAISTVFQETLENANNSRTFYTQVLLPGASDPNRITDEDFVEKPTSSKSSSVAEYKYVRTDNKATTLDRFVNRPNSSSSGSSSNIVASTNDEEDSMEIETDQKERVIVTLHSVLTLRKEIKSNDNKGLTNMFSNHTFIGCVDDMMALIQYEQDIYLINYTVASEELFYQIVIQEFNNMGQIRLSTPISIKECAITALTLIDQEGDLPSDFKNIDEIAESITSTLVARAEMLALYFSFQVSKDGNITAIPMLLRDYVPCMEKLPLFILRLGTEVDWENEKGCFHTLAKEFAILFRADPVLNQDKRKEYLWNVQHLIFPSFKAYFSAPTKLKNYVTRLANLTDLYKIFERC